VFDVTVEPSARATSHRNAQRVEWGRLAATASDTKLALAPESTMACTRGSDDTKRMYTISGGVTGCKDIIDGGQATPVVGDA